MICNKCGTENPDGSRFCENCGAPLAAEAPSPAVSEPKPELKFEPAPAPAVQTADTPAPQPQQPAYSAKPVAPPAAPEQNKGKKENPHINDNLSVWGYIWTFFVMGIPVVGLVFVLVWAFRSRTNKNRRHLAWAMIILFLVSLALNLCLYFFVPGIRELSDNATNAVREWVEIIQTVKSNPEILQYYSAGAF